MGTNVLPGAQSLNEWGATFKGFVVGCGEAGALIVSHIVKGTPLSTAQLQQLINQGGASGHLSGAGYGQTAPDVQWDLAQYGIGSTVQYGHDNLGQLLDQALAAGKPVEVGFNYGAALTGETSGLRGHYADIVGKTPGGLYVTADPNSRQSLSGDFTYNSLQQLLAADPFAEIFPNSGAGPGSGVDTTGSTGSSTGGTVQGSTLGFLPGPGDWVNAIKSGFTDATQRMGLVFFGLLLILLGVAVLFFSAEGTAIEDHPEASQAAEAAAG